MKTSPFQISFLKKAILFSGVAMIAVAAPAHAGFEWKGPLEAPRAAAPSAPADAADDMAPVTADAPASRAPAVPPAPVAQQPIPAAMPAPHAAMPAAEAPEAAGDVLTGFGTDVPLVIALQQVVPAGYQYSFANGVNPGTNVSWEGGKPWQQVLSDMLGKQNLGYQLQNNTVVVSEDATDGAAPAAAPAPAAPAANWHAPTGANTVSAPPAADDLAPVSITSAQPAPAAAPAPAATPAPEAAAPAAAPAAAEAPVTIHREKKKSFFERLGWTKSSDSDEADSAEKHEGQTQVDQYKPRAASDTPRTTSDDGVRMPSDTAAPQKADDAAPAAKSSDLTAPPASTTTANVAAAASAEAASNTAPQNLAAATPAAVAGDWAGKKGQTLHEVLKAWSDKAGVELYWSIDYDYRLSADASYNGKYEDAVGGLLERFSTVRPQPYGQLRQSASGPRVLEVKSYDLTR